MDVDSNKERKMKTYKGFDKNLQCRGFQYEVGKEYEIEGEIAGFAVHLVQK